MSRNNAPAITMLLIAAVLCNVGSVAAPAEPAPLAAGAAPQVTSGIAEVPQPAIYYEIAGEGQPVILIHGGQMDRRMWDAQFPVLAQRYRVIRYDVRGYGRSAVPTAAYSDVRDLLSLMDTLKIDRAVLIGMSLGGRVSIDFALEHPERVAALIAVAPGLSGHHDDDPEGDARYYKMIEAARDKGLEAANELWLQDPIMAPAMEHPEIAEKIRGLCLDNAHNWLDNPFWGQGIVPRAAGRLQEIKKPALLIIGDRDVPALQKIGALLEKEVAGVRKVVIKGAGHIAPMEYPGQFNGAVLEFLKSLPPPVPSS